VNLPALSPTMEKGNLLSWVKSEGDEVKEGDALAQIETDKATMDFEAPEDGFLAKIVTPAGSKGVPLGSVGFLMCLYCRSAKQVMSILIKIDRIKICRERATFCSVYQPIFFKFWSCIIWN